MTLTERRKVASVLRRAARIIDDSRNPDSVLLAIKRVAPDYFRYWLILASFMQCDVYEPSTRQMRVIALLLTAEAVLTGDTVIL